MKTRLAFTLACALAAFVTPALAQNDKPIKTGLILSQSNHVSATVEDIDHSARKITLKGPDGNTVKLTVGDEVRNFSQIKKGDHVGVTYRESLALAVAKPGEPLTPTSRIETGTRAAAGEKPGAAAAAITQTSVVVENVDRDKHEVTLKGPDGDLEKVLVDPSIGDLEHIKKGDRINVMLTQALAISVTQPDQ